MDYTQVTALVTGAGSGLGAATALALAQAGARVGVLDLDHEKAQAVATQCAGVPLHADVTDPDAVATALDALHSPEKPLRMLVNCAGVAPAARLVGRAGPLPLELFQQAVQVNLLGTVNVMRLGAAAMSVTDPAAELQGRGVIINTASIAAFEGQIGQCAYSASKGGIIAMTLPAARELAQFGIRVNTLAPGLMETPLMADMPDMVKSDLQAQVPYPKRFGKPAEFAALVKHVIENPYLNGETIRLDGALRMPAR